MAWTSISDADWLVLALFDVQVSETALKHQRKPQKQTRGVRHGTNSDLHPQNNSQKNNQTRANSQPNRHQRIAVPLIDSIAQRLDSLRLQEMPRLLGRDISHGRVVIFATASGGEIGVW